MFCPTVFVDGMSYPGAQIGCGQGDGPLLTQSSVILSRNERLITRGSVLKGP
jgi:hypothetical protein